MSSANTSSSLLTQTKFVLLWDWFIYSENNYLPTIINWCTKALLTTYFYAKIECEPKKFYAYTIDYIYLDSF